jgi:uncharacterized membrane protein
MTRAAGSRAQLASHVLARHARATPRAPSTPSRVVSKIFAERVAGPAVAQKKPHAEREHADDRPSAVSV